MDGYYASGSDFVHNYVLEMKNPNFSSILDGDLNLLSFFSFLVYMWLRTLIVYDVIYI